MKSIKIMGLLSVAALITSCADDVYDEQYATPNALRVEVVDELGEGSSTRAEYTGFHTEFSEGDEIGVYAFNGSAYISSNVKFTKQADGSWLPESNVAYNPSYAYYAYFPYVSSPYTPSADEGGIDVKFADFITDTGNKFWSADQSTEAGYTASNLMVSQGVLYSDKTVKFTMKHERGLAVIRHGANKWYYSDATGTKYDITMSYTGNIPYTIDDSDYFLMKPGTDTSVAGMSMRASAGKYVESEGVELTGTPTYQYSVSTNEGSSWGSFTTTKPDWLTVQAVTVDGTPTDFSATVTSTKSTSVSKGTGAIRNVPGDAVLKAATSVSDVDLSMVNNDGSARASRTTANCYLIHAAGTYKLPLVYGNAIVNGAGNPSAYHTTQTSNTLQNLVNHADQAIYTGDDTNDPWIKSHGITVDGASLIWQDVKGLISEVGVDGDYLTFTVSGENIAEGNAVIAATEGGTVVWSWQIWATTQTFSESDLTSIATGSHTYKVAPVNVGQVSGYIGSGTTYAGSLCKVRATSNGATVEFQVTQPDYYEVNSSSTYYNPSPYYQWGRKDAELPCIGGYVMDGSSFSFSYLQSAVSIGTTIQNPGIHYYNSSNSGPYNENKCNYWDMNQTSDGDNIATATVKTVYDPCPPGFCVPTGNLYYYWASSWGSYSGSAVWDSTNKGLKVTKGGGNLFFPASGDRYYSNGSLYNVGSGGSYWSASAGNTDNGRYLNFASRYWFWNDYYRADGVSVRPVLSE